MTSSRRDPGRPCGGGRTAWEALDRSEEPRSVRSGCAATKAAGTIRPGSPGDRNPRLALDEILADARRGQLVGRARTGVPFREAAEEWLRHGEHERGLKPSTLVDYRSTVSAYLVPAFGDLPLESMTPDLVDQWRRGLLARNGLSPRTVNKALTVLHGIMEHARRVWRLPANPVADVERAKQRYTGDFDFFSPEEVMALVRAAASEQDGAMYLTAAFAGLRRGELVALRWRDVDFAGEAIRVRGNFSHGQVVSPKSGKIRTVPMVPAVAEALARLANRERFTADDDIVFRVRRASTSTPPPFAVATCARS